MLALIAFGALALFAHTASYFPADLTIAASVQAFNPPWFDLLMRVVNWMGFSIQGVFFSALVALVLLLFGWRWEALVSAISAAAIWALNILIGLVVARPYPDAPVPGVFMDLTKPSFPSGHVTSYIVIYGFAFLVFSRRLKPSWWRTILLIFCAALPILVIPSRIYLGRHWPAMCSRSVLLGTVCLALTIRIYEWGRGRWLAGHTAAGSAELTKGVRG